jgi:photosystem II stability/assembly factor-like uncharacterized protein
MAKAALLFAGTDDGLVQFTNPGGVGRWLRAGHALRGAPVRLVWLAPDNPRLLLAASSERALWRSVDGGETWAEALADGVTALAGGLADGPLLAATADGRLLRSEDSGQTWAPAPAPGPVRVLAPGPAGTLLAAGPGGVWASADGGAAWSLLGANSPRAVTGLAVAGDTVYALSGGALFRCAAHDDAWQALDAPPAPLSGLIVLPGRAPALLASAGASLLRSADGGNTWTATTADPAWAGPVQALAPSGYHIDTAFAGDAAGMVAISTDRGRTWQLIRQGLPPVRSLASGRIA